MSLRQQSETRYACHCGWTGNRGGAADHWSATGHDAMEDDGGFTWRHGWRTALTDVVEVDPSFADWMPNCAECGQRIESWTNALLMPCAVTEDDPPDRLGAIHRICP